MLHVLVKAIPVRAHLRNIRGRTVYIRPSTREGEKTGPRRFVTTGQRKAKIKPGQEYEYKTEKMSRPAKLKVVSVKGERVEVEFPSQQRAEKPRRYVIAAHRLRAAAQPAKKEKPAHPPVKGEGQLVEKWEGAIVARAKRAATRYHISVEYEKGRPSGTFEDLVQSLREEFIKVLRRETARGETHHDPVQSALYTLEDRSNRLAAQLSKEVGIPRRVIKRLSHIARVERGLENELGRRSTDRELFDRVKDQESKKPKAKQWDWNAPGDEPKSMDYESFQHAREELQNRMSLDPEMMTMPRAPLVHVETPEEGARRNILSERIRQVMGEKLGKNERNILAGVHGMGYEFDELAGIMKLTPERVEDIHGEALKKLRSDKKSLRRLSAYLKAMGQPAAGMALAKAVEATPLTLPLSNPKASHRPTSCPTGGSVSIRPGTWTWVT